MAVQTPSTSVGDARRVKLDPAEGARERLKSPRNAPCPCGSGKNYEKCCLRDDEDLVHQTPNGDEFSPSLDGDAGTEPEEEARFEAETLRLAEHFLPIEREDHQLMPSAVPDRCELIFELRAGQVIRTAATLDHSSPGVIAEELRRGVEEEIHPVGGEFLFTGTCTGMSRP